MNKLILSFILGMSMAFTLAAKDKVIVNPVVDFTNSGITHISKIELGDKETRLYIHSIFIPHWWVNFTKEAYIEDCATGKKYQATGMLNGEFDKGMMQSLTHLSGI
jgi:hypothetical protein